MGASSRLFCRPSSMNLGKRPRVSTRLHNLVFCAAKAVKALSQLVFDHRRTRYFFPSRTGTASFTAHFLESLLLSSADSERRSFEPMAGRERIRDAN